MSEKEREIRKTRPHVYENILVPASEVNQEKFADNADNLVHLVNHTLIAGKLEVLEVMSMCGVDYYKCGHITNDTSIVTCALCIRDYNALNKMLRGRDERDVRNLLKNEARAAAVNPSKLEKSGDKDDSDC